ncbi:MAG: trypsin-like serine protease [Phycisphaerales bacterium]|nr:trypsin-like serine protease [Phycisphaerales bacterium]
MRTLGVKLLITALMLGACSQNASPPHQAAYEESGETGESNSRAAAIRSILRRKEADRRGSRNESADDSLIRSIPIDPQIEFLLHDQVFVDNVWQELRRFDADPHSIGPEVFQGIPVPTGFEHCVAVGCDKRWHCSGVLIASNAVLTASHCFCGGQNGACGPIRVAFGADIYSPDETVGVIGDPIAYSDCDGLPSTEHDLCILILERDVDFRPARLDRNSRVDQESSLRVAGFGLDEKGVAGIKLMAAVYIASSDCNSAESSGRYCCHAPYELVAGGPLLQDTCSGDSGGPAYLSSDTSTVAAITSRPICGDAQCGNGGVYVRVDRHIDWIMSIPGINW